MPSHGSAPLSLPPHQSPVSRTQTIITPNKAAPARAESRPEKRAHYTLSKAHEATQTILQGAPNSGAI